MIQYFWCSIFAFIIAWFGLGPAWRMACNHWGTACGVRRNTDAVFLWCRIFLEAMKQTYLIFLLSIQYNHIKFNTDILLIITNNIQCMVLHKIFIWCVCMAPNNWCLITVYVQKRFWCKSTVCMMHLIKRTYTVN